MQQQSQTQVTNRIHSFLDKKTRGRLSDDIADLFLKPRTSRFGSDMSDAYEALPWRGAADSK